MCRPVPNSSEYRDAQTFAQFLNPQPPEVQEASQFLLAIAMHEGGNPRFGKFELLSVAEVDGRWHYTFSGAGEVFSVVRPEMSKEMERRVRNTKVTKAHEIHERKSCRQADFRAFRGLSQLS